MFDHSGRFSVNAIVCTTFTSQRTEEWNPSWTVEGLLTGFLSFMTDEEHAAGTVRQKCTPEERSQIVKESKRWNSLFCPNFVHDFPERHADNLESEKFTESEMKKCLAILEKYTKGAETDSVQTAVSGKEGLLDTSYESFTNEDWEKFGSMEDDFEEYDDDGDEIDLDDDENETSDTQMDVEEKD
jgi:hypothetical protein